MQGTILQNRFYKPNKNTVSVLSDGKVKIFYWRLWYKLWKLIISSDKPCWCDACLCCHYRFSTSTFRMASLTNAVTQFSTEADLQQVGYLILSLKCSCAKSSTVFAFRGMCRRSCTLKNQVVLECLGNDLLVWQKMLLSEKLRQFDQEITLYVTKRENLLLTSARMGKCWLLLLLLFLIFISRLFDYIR